MFCVNAGKCWQKMEFYSVVSREDVRAAHEQHAVEVVDSYCPMCEYDKTKRRMVFDIDAASAKEPAKWRMDSDNWIKQKKLEIDQLYEQEIERS